MPSDYVLNFILFSSLSENLLLAIYARPNNIEDTSKYRDKRKDIHSFKSVLLALTLDIY